MKSNSEQNRGLKIIGQSKNQKVIEVKIAGCLKASNQTNPRSGGTTLVYVVKRKRNELGKKVRKDYEKKKVTKRLCDMRDWEAVPQKNSNTITGVQIDNLILVPKDKDEKSKDTEQGK